MLRKTVSMTALVSFAVLLLTSVVLYFEPHGRVAYWGDWRFLGLTKTDWDGIHLTVGVLLVACLLLHVWLNWKPLVNAMRNKARQFKFLTPPVVFSLALTLFVAAGTLLGLPPMRQILDISAWLKDSHTATYGNPPYGHAELSTLKDFAELMGLDPVESLAALETEGLAAALDQTLAEIGRANEASPREIYDIIRSARPEGSDPFSALPATPPEGTGRMTLNQLAETYDLPLSLVLERLALHGLEAAPEQTVKDIAARAGREPAQVYQLLRNAE